jgi:hypothetical protein
MYWYPMPCDTAPRAPSSSLRRSLAALFGTVLYAHVNRMYYPALLSNS